MNRSFASETPPEFGIGGSSSQDAAPARVDDRRAVQSAPAISAGSKSSALADGPIRASWVLAVCGFLVLAAGVVFGQTLGFDFLPHFDDGRYVCRNPHITPGLTLAGLRYAVTDAWAGEYYPLTSLSHMADCQFYALNPAGHHLTNVLLHCLSAVLLFLALLRMTGDFWPSSWVAAVFAIHPLHVSSVAWIAERRELLAGLFFMLILWAYAGYAQRPSPGRYLAVLGFLVAGLMSKPTVVTAPFVLLLLDYWPLGRFRDAGPPAKVAWRLVAEKIPLMACSLLSCLLTMFTHQHNPVVGMTDPVSFPMRLANALVSYAAYVAQSFYPVNLSPFYPNLGPHLPILWAVEALVLLSAITAIVAFLWRRLPCLLVGWLWFLGMLVPLLGLVGSFLQSRADNYTYLSQIGLLIAVAWGVWTIYRSRPSLQALRWPGYALGGISVAAVLCLAAIAWRQTSYWRNAEAVWTCATSCTEQNALGHHNLAVTYLEDGQGRTDQAIAHLRQSLASYSISRSVTADTHCLLAFELAKQGRTDEGFAELEEAVRTCPTSELCHAYLAMALADAGKRDQSIAKWREAHHLLPKSVLLHLGLAEALLADDRPDEGIDHCREILKQAPDAVETMITLGAALAAEGQTAEAIPHLERALVLDPGNIRARFNLGVALCDGGKPRSGLAYLDEAIRRQPHNVSFLWHTAWVLATCPDSSIRDGVRALELAQKALQLSDGKEPHVLDCAGRCFRRGRRFSGSRPSRQASLDRGLGWPPRNVVCRHRAAGSPLPPGFALSAAAGACAGRAGSQRLAGPAGIEPAAARVSRANSLVPARCPSFWPRGQSIG